MITLTIVFVVVGVIAWRNPMAGVAIALHTHVFRTALQSWMTGSAIPGLEVEEIWQYSAVLLVPALGLPLLKVAGKILLGVPFKRMHAGWSAVSVGLVLIGLVLLVGCSYAPDGRLAINSLLRFLVASIPYYLLGRMWPVYADSPAHGTHVFMKWTWILAVAAILIAVFYSPLYTEMEHEATRFTTAGSNPIAFAFLLGTALLAAVYWLFRSKDLNPWFRPVIYGSIVILLYFMVAANTRAPFICCALSLVYMVCGLRWKQTSRLRFGLKSIALVGVLLVGVWVAAAFDPDMLERFSDRMDALRYGADPGKEVDTVEQRLFYYRVAWDLFMEFPFLGAGTGAVAVYAGEFTHNIFLETAGENGVIGLLALIIFVCGVSYYAIISLSRNSPPECIFFAACSLFVLFWATISGSLVGLKDLYFCAGTMVSLVAWFREARMPGTARPPYQAFSARVAGEFPR